MIALSIQQKSTIRNLCEEYIWWTLVAQNCGSTLSEQRRVEIHETLAKILEIEVWDGCFSIFRSLEDLGFKISPSPDPEHWEGITKIIGRKAMEYMLHEL